MPEISVVVPVYNAERFLRQCLDSILNQTFKDIEVICVNDCSTDSSLEILKEYEQKYKNVSCLSHGSNSGMSCSRNSGLDAASGKYLYFIDSDDFIEPDTLEKVHAYAEKCQSEITIFDFKVYYEDTKSFGYFRDQIYYSKLRGRIFTLEEEPELASFVGVWDRLFLREFLIKNNFRFLPGMIYEDVPYTIETLLKAKRISLLPEHFHYYRRNAGGSIVDNESKNRKCRTDFVAVRRYSFEKMKEAGCSDKVYFFFLSHFMEQVLMHARFCKGKREFKSYFENLSTIFDDHLFSLCEELKEEDKRIFAKFIQNNQCGKAYSWIANNK